MDSSTEKPKRSLRKTWGFRFAAIGMVCFPLVIIELLLTWLQPPWLNLEVDPLLGFSQTRPLFELNPERSMHQIRKDRLSYFVQNRFHAAKPENAFRIFCLGGSTVQGRPYSIETSFTTWLRITLETSYPDQTFEIVNGGGVSYASYRLIPILKECLQYKPDLIILCTGNNEFLEDRSYPVLKTASPVVDSVVHWASRFNLAKATMALGQKWTKEASPHSRLPTEVRAMLDYERGIERYRRNQDWRSSVESHFQSNVDRMIRMTREAKVPLMLVSPCFDLRDSPPFKSEHRANMSSEDLELWQQSMAKASASMGEDLMQAIHHLKQAIQLDPQHASSWYALGQAYVQRGQMGMAKQCFEKALDTDVCPLRMTAPLRKTLYHLKDRWDLSFLDLQNLASQTSLYGIAGKPFLVDHVHPSIRSHQLIAIELFEMIQKNWLPPSNVADTETKRDTSFQTHLDTLPALYFQHGIQRLNNLKAWSQGRADGEAIEAHPHISDGI